MNTSRLTRMILVLALAASGAAQAADDSASDSDKIEAYREMISDGNPAEFDEMRGEELWKTAAGPNQATLEKCDLGKGPGVVKGAYAELPRYFKDTGKVQDLESRLLTCMTTLQGLTEEQVAAKPFASDKKPSDISSLATYVVGQSKGVKMAVSVKHPKEKEAYEIGKRIFNYRAGPYDFACSTCHATSGVRIRMQDLPNLSSNKKDAQSAYTTWPAYRVSQGLTRSFQWRLNDCFRQQRFPEPKFASEATVALTTFLAVSANGAKYDGPGLKR
ncbi:MAG TPA: sulfur oxidation c-type cytochrome SoxA [Gallionellaceae bacterium]|nr:sulfur oxidation c-type cytochrome SoxA [Gallionellaceae bacterium]